MTTVVVSAPASSANLGPGFDCLGMGLQLYHRLTVSTNDSDAVEIRATGEGANDVPLDATNHVYHAMCRSFDVVGYHPAGLVIESNNEIPISAGLGSSAAACLVGLVAGMLISGQEVDLERLVRFGTVEEGHADNIVPSIFGGFTVINVGVEHIDHIRLEPPDDLRAVVAIPNFSLPTEKSRMVLPEHVPFKDAVANQGRVGLLTAALASGRLELLQRAMEDCLHQPYRAELVPGMEQVREAALAAGALGAVLSGAGPAILGLVVSSDDLVAKAMVEAWADWGVITRTLILPVDRTGLTYELL